MKRRRYTSRVFSDACERSKYYAGILLVIVHVIVRACVRACVRVCVRCVFVSYLVNFEAWVCICPTHGSLLLLKKDDEVEEEKQNVDPGHTG